MFDDCSLIINENHFLQLVYRDRAKERRDKFGTEDSAKRNDYSPVHERSYPSSSHRTYNQSKTQKEEFQLLLFSSFVQLESSDSSAGSDSIGSKLMKKHGWQEGQGLGKKLQGRADPLQVSSRKT